MSGEALFVLLGIAAFLFGLRASIRLSRRYRDVTPLLVPRERSILGAFVIVAWVITVAAGFFDFLSARRLLGFASIEWTPIVSILVASAVLFVPVFLDLVVSRVARVPWRGDPK